MMMMMMMAKLWRLFCADDVDKQKLLKAKRQRKAKYVTDCVII